MPQAPPDVRRLAEQSVGAQLLRALEAGAAEKNYLHWDQLRRRPAPDHLTPELWWAGVRLARALQARPLPLYDSAGNAFSITLPDRLLEGLQNISRQTTATVRPELAASAPTRHRYLINSLIEEGIASSQLEGALTTQQVAKEMLRTGRAPRNRSERMIANNYAGMRFIREHLDEELTPALVCELHEVLTKETLDDPRAAGRLQLPGDMRVGVWSAGNVKLHQPPRAEQLPARLAQLCDFANAEGGWLHPVLRAIITHFMVGYDHYFIDGNGRTARALFYWVALKNQYQLLEFVAISRVLRQAPVRYARSYLHTESDDGDVTYFAIEQVRVITKAIDELNDYLSRKADDRAATQQAVSTLGLNHREVAIAEGILKGSVYLISVASHARSHAVTLATARSDLKHLETLGLLSSHAEGRRVVWQPAPEAQQRLAPLGGSQG